MSVKQFTESISNGTAHFIVKHHFSNGKTLFIVMVCLFGVLTIVCLTIVAVYKALQNIRPGISFTLRHLGKGTRDIPQSLLELTFPADTTKSAYATEQLHILMRGHIGYRGHLERLAAQLQPYSLELVGTNDDGIRFVLRIPTFAMDTIRHNLLSYLPGLKIKETQDYLKSSLLDGQPYRISELALNSDFVLPLKDHKTLSEHDFIAYLTGHMTKLLPSELIAYQVVVVPVLAPTHSRVIRHVRKIQQRIASRQELSSKLNSPGSGLGKLALAFLKTFMTITAFLLKLLAGLIEVFVQDNTPGNVKNTAVQQITNPYELELHDSVKTKLDQPLYEVSIRILVVGPNTTTINERLNAIVSSFRPFASSYQSLGRARSMPLIKKHQKRLARFQNRTLTPHLSLQRPILSSSELADLYHFPNTDLTKTEGMVKSRSQELPAPLSIRHSDAKLDVIVGVNKHGGEEQPIGMTLEQREKHTYIIGKTGTGKTTLLKASIYQDMVNGNGLAMLDAHGDMFNEILSIVPEHRQKDVIVFDPSDWDYPIGLNILDPGIPFATDREKHQKITANVLAVFAKLADEKQWGQRMEHILKSTTMTALQLPNPNLFTLQRLLTEKSYQKKVAKTLKDPVLKQFWAKEFKLQGDMQISTATAPLTHRLGHFITSVMSRHILLQEKSTISISDIMNEGKILLVNLSKGEIGEDESTFFGTILTSFIWMAAYQRTKIPESKRRDFFLYVDEFQNFATPSFSEISSEGRKYHVPLIVSHQNIAQIKDKDLLKVIVGNSHTIICLKASPDDEKFILPYMEPVVEKGDIVNLTPYHFFMKTTADESEDAFSGITVPLTITESEETKEAVKANSRQQFATPVKTVEAYMEKLFGPEQMKKRKRGGKGGGTKGTGTESENDSGGLVEG